MSSMELMTTLFVGLGPRGLMEVTKDDLSRLFENLRFGEGGAEADDDNHRVHVGGIRHLGAAAFVDVGSMDEASFAIAKLHGALLPNGIRLVVRLDDAQDCHRPHPRRCFFPRNPSLYAPPTGVTTLFIGLGPRGLDVTEAQLHHVLAEVTAVRHIRHRGAVAYVDVEHPWQDVAAVVNAVNGTVLSNGVRLVVRLDSWCRPMFGSDVPSPATVVTLFVGLGPRGWSASVAELRYTFGMFGATMGIRHRGTHAFIDMGCMDQAFSAAAGLHGTTLSNGARLVVRLER